MKVPRDLHYGLLVLEKSHTDHRIGVCVCMYVCTYVYVSAIVNHAHTNDFYGKIKVLLKLKSFYWLYMFCV